MDDPAALVIREDEQCGSCLKIKRTIDVGPFGHDDADSNPLCYDCLQSIAELIKED